MIFAKVDVKLRDHVRAHKAGVAMSTWLWALLYAREQETDGVIPEIALRLAWPGEKEARRHADILVAVGLWEKHEEGWRICRYGSKNDTAASIAERRKETRDRVSKFRRNAVGNASRNALHDVSVTESTAPAVPGSRSYSYSRSVSGSDLPEGELEREVTSQVQRVIEPAVTADPATDAPDWWPGVVETIAMGTGIDLPEREAWLRYAGHRASKARPAERRDAVHWLTTVMVKEARDDREKARHQRERDAKFDARRAGPASPADATKLSDAEQKDLAERFPMRRRDRGAA